ncbi:MAG: YciI family protein [Pseudohongiella sp.]
MKVMIMRKADTDTEKGVMPSDDMLQAMADYNEEMLNAGVMIDGTGLKPTSTGVRVQFKSGEPMVIDGPFAETKELLAGFTMINVTSMDEAIAWAKKWPRMDSDGNVTLELRILYEMEDFIDGEGIEKHKRSAARLARQPTSMSTHLSFNGNCREAMSFYADVLSGEVTFMLPYADTPMKDETDADWQDKIIHAEINLGGRVLMGADAPPAMYEKPTGTSVQLYYDDVAIAKEVFDALLVGGSVYMPFAETFWAKGFGMLTDKYGIHWMINAGSPDA